MKISIIHDLVRWEEKALLKAATDRGMEVSMVDVKDMDMDLDSQLSDSYGGVSIQRCTSYYRGLHSTAFLEYKGQIVVNDLNSTTTAGNKMLTSLALVKNRVPTPRTSVSTGYEAAMKQFSGKFGNRAVIKPVTGSWGRMVALLNDKSAATAVLEDREYMYPLYSIFYLQEYVRRPPRDIRTFVVGDRVIGGIYRYQSEGDWRTNTAIGGRAEKCEITPELEDISIRAARSVGRGVFGIDIMETDSGYVVHEVNGTTEFKNTVRVAGVDVPGEIIEYVKGVAR